MKRIIWIDGVCNEGAVDRIKENRNIIINREGDWMRHICRGKGILITVFEDTVKQERRRRRNRLKLIEGVKRGRYERTKEKAWARSNWRQQ